jgi:hypothetical protein
MAKRLAGMKSERDAWERYRSAVLRLNSESKRKNTSVLGFVKRPRSKYLAQLYGWRGFDHVVLSTLLEPGQYYPDPPLSLSDLILEKKIIHEEEVEKIIRMVKPKATYVRFNSSTPPYRVDFGHHTVDYKDILGYLYSIRTRVGIPYIIMKADEETKITKRLIRDLYEDILHDYIAGEMGPNPNRLIPLLPEYGGM